MVMGAFPGSGWFGAASLGLLFGTALGALSLFWWNRRVFHIQHRLPKSWPLSPRQVLNSEELKVWRWLTEAFYDHSVMVKMPVTRFTVPIDRTQGRYWYELLGGVYCTFTVINNAGHVLACIDVPNRLGISRRNHAFNEPLLKKCGIPYLTMRSTRLPSVYSIRTEILGQISENSREGVYEPAPIRAASDSLRASLMHMRSVRNSDLSPLSQGPDSVQGNLGEHMGDESQFAPAWNDNSFTMPLDSRKAEMN